MKRLLVLTTLSMTLLSASAVTYVALAQHQHSAPKKAADPHAGHKAAPSSSPSHAGHQMTPGMKMDKGPPPVGRRAKPKAAPPAKPAPSHAGHGQMPGIKTDKGADPHAGHKPAQSSPAAPAHGEHNQMPGMKKDAAGAADPHAGHGAAAQTKTGADLPVGNEPAPAISLATAADAVFGTASMDRARNILRDEHGGSLIFKIMADQIEYQSGPHGAGYEWRGEAWYGGDINRFVLKSEGTGTGSDGVERAELQGLYSRAVGRYTDLQVGIRQDFNPLTRTYATIGVEALLPYWFKVDGALFFSETGTVFARLEGTYDFTLTQRLVLEPRVELNASFQDERGSRTGSGISDAELGLRLRYEITRDFAPYIGVSHERSLGRTADFNRAVGRDTEATKFVLGLRAWL